MSNPNPSTHVCPTCGSPVRIVGQTTQHYEPRYPAEAVERLIAAAQAVQQNFMGIDSDEALAMMGLDLALTALAALKGASG